MSGKIVLRSIMDSARIDAILDAVSGLDPSGKVMSEASGRLDALPSSTHLEEIDSSPDGVFEHVGDPSRFEAAATAYVRLNYGSKRENLSMSDSYPVSVRGHFDGPRAVVDSVTVDVESVYE